MRSSGRGSGKVADGMSAQEGGAWRDRGREDLGRYVSPRLRQMLTAAGDDLVVAGSERLRRNGPEHLEAVLSELLEELPGSFYPVYNAERERWELGIR